MQYKLKAEVSTYHVQFVNWFHFVWSSLFGCFIGLGYFAGFVSAVSFRVSVHAI